jgi:hypothetical protein
LILDPKSRLLLFELNEFNDTLLRDAVKTYGLKNLGRLLELNRTYLATADTYESDFLEPWVQWVSLHTGVPSQVHQVKHLGDVPELAFPQLWELLAEKGVTTGVWGVLNGSRGRHQDKNLFFLPDPWTFSEQAYPPELNGLLGLPRFLATNRMKFSGLRLLKEAALFLKTLVDPTLITEFLKWAPLATFTTLRDRAAYGGFCFVEYLSGLLFLKYWRAMKPQFGVLFVNSIAHIQHYYWKDVPLEKNRRLRYGFVFMDALVGELLKEVDNGVQLVVTNALSQKNTNDEPEWVSYRPIDHGRFLTFAGAKPTSVEPLMSYDALVFFAGAEDCQEAKRILESGRIGDKPLFLVETYPANPNKLFYRFQFTEPAPPDARCSVNGKEFAFGEQFKKITSRTGKHIPKADVYATLRNFARRQENHAVFHNIASYFDVTPGQADAR